MISKIVSLLTALGLVASISAKVKTTEDTKVLHTSAADGLQLFDHSPKTDGRTAPPTP